jgi:signal transduction histidine kinase
LDAGLGAFDLIRLHHEALTNGVLPADAEAAGRLAPSLEVFLLEALAPFEASNRGIRNARERLQQLNGVLANRNEALALTNAQLEEEIVQHQQNEVALRASKDRYFDLFQQAQAMEENLHTLSAEVFSAREDDRKRISRELHEEIAQALAAVNVTVALLKKQAGPNSPFQRDVVAAEQLLVQSMETVHSFARELRPATLDYLGVQSALQDHVAEFGRQTRIATELITHPLLGRLESRQGEVLFRVVQDSLNQFFRPARPAALKVEFTAEDDALCMEITGKNCAASLISKTAPAADRVGILALQERVRSINGLCAVVPTSRGDLRIKVQIPLAPPAGRPERTTTSGSSHHSPSSP